MVSVVKEKPVLICEVMVLPEDEDESDAARELASEVADLLRSTLRLNVKLQGIVASEDALEPEELVQLGPQSLSYW